MSVHSADVAFAVLFVVVVVGWFVSLAIESR